MSNQNKILIIEDDPAVASSLQAGLQQEGYSVHWQNSGRAGVEYAQNENPHLIILDVRLPDGSGFDFCRQLRQLKLHQPILMLTARRDEMDKVLGLEMVADDYMTKPFGLRELVSRIRAMLRRSYGEFASSQNQDQLFIQDLVIHTEQGQVWRDDRPLNLTPTEFRLLVFMARHANQALSRAQMLAHVWGYDTAVELESERTINVHIRRLREKIERNPSQPSILLTVPSVGYRLVS